MDKIKVSFKLNNKEHTIETTPLRRLLDILREDFKITGTKEGCGEGECGACSVLIDGELALSCITPATQLEGKEIVTIEGIAKENGEPSYIQQAFIDKGAVQCGFCTPGFVLATHKYIEEIGEINDIKIKEALSGNFCRCTGYTKIIDGVKEAIHRHNDKGDK
jgi:carbon-monoxide dehydrogenase small subunit